MRNYFLLLIIGGWTCWGMCTPRQVTYRDPFWPIEYQPIIEVVEVPAEKQVPQEVAPVNAINVPRNRRKTSASMATPKEWIMAKKALKISGLTYARRLGSRTAQKVMYVNGKGYSEGEVISVEHQNKRFYWRLYDDLSGQSFYFKPMKVECLSEKSSTSTLR